MLFDLKIYGHCIKLCKMFEGANQIVQVYEAKSMYYTYCTELVEKIEKRLQLPGFEYKVMMRSFCNSRIIPVIQKLTASSNAIQQEGDHEAVCILDKALVDCLIFNIEKVKTCLLCHTKTNKLVHSHYISKFILQRFAKTIGYDKGDSVIIFSPSDQPSDWQLKSAAKITFSMLCRSCDGSILSQDENLFKKGVFDMIYSHNGSHLLQHTLSYDEYLYRFTAGLIFRSMAQFCSTNFAEIEQFKQIHCLMQFCREACIGLSDVTTAVKSKFKLYLIPLPSILPSSLPKHHGWDTFVSLANSPYGAYKLLEPGEHMLPKKLYCFLVKIGVMLFVASLDVELDFNLKKTCGFYEINLPSQKGGTCNLTIPEDNERAELIPVELWWNLLDWAKEKENIAMSVALSFDSSEKFMAGHGLSDIIEHTVAPIHANLLPPGFKLNFERAAVFPENICSLPPYHSVLLHNFFSITSGAIGLAILARLKINEIPDAMLKEQSVHLKMMQPYLLVYIVLPHLVFKGGFLIDEKDYSIKDILPGCHTEMKDSIHLEELAEQFPEIVRTTLRAKGFRSLKSLLSFDEYWHATSKDR